MSKRKTPGINGSSSADIAFMLLIFFLITTSMGSDKGIARRLPPAIPPDMKEDIKIDVNKRNMLRVLVNARGQVLCNGEQVDLNNLRERVKEFVLNPNDDPSLPDKEVVDIPLLGKMKVTKAHVISLTNTVDTRYADYIAVQNELTRAYTELRDDFAMQKWGKHFDKLDEEQQEAVRTLYKQKISEAEPKEYGRK